MEKIRDRAVVIFLLLGFPIVICVALFWPWSDSIGRFTFIMIGLFGLFGVPLFLSHNLFHRWHLMFLPMGFLAILILASFVLLGVTTDQWVGVIQDKAVSWSEGEQFYTLTVTKGETSVNIGVSASTYNKVRIGLVVRVRHVQQGIFDDNAVDIIG